MELTSIIEKRRSLHRELVNQQEQNDELKSQLGHLQALANIGTTTCMIAHEINNLLTPLSNYAAMALQDRKDAELTEKALVKSARNGERIRKIMDSLLAVANGQCNQKEQCELAGLVDEVFGSLGRDFNKDGIRVEARIPEGLKVFAVPVQLQQVLMNLILNSRDAMMLERGGVLTIEAGRAGDFVKILVRDTGCGINSRDIDRIFEPFFTTKKGDGWRQGSGTGLGLAFCRTVVESHKGELSVKSEPGHGTEFEIKLPNNVKS